MNICLIVFVLFLYFVLPVDDELTPACVKLHGLFPAPRLPAVLTHEPVLVSRAGVGTVWTYRYLRKGLDAACWAQAVGVPH
eukprot:2458621-Amphidinium_carterae.1